MKNIRTAIIPVAGRGTRLLPLTKTTPKELLLVHDRPVIEFVVREALEAGIEKVILVINSSKEEMRTYFADDSRVKFAYQDEPLGDGHAIAQALPLVDTDEPVAVLFGDELIDNPSGKNALQQMLQVFEHTQKPVIGLQDVPLDQVSKYGIVSLDENFTVQQIQEKPSPKEALSTFAVIGKYILTSEVLARLHETEAHSDGEIRLSGTFQQMLQEGKELAGCIIEGERFDTGSHAGLEAAGSYFSQK